MIHKIANVTYSIPPSFPRFMFLHFKFTLMLKARTIQRGIKTKKNELEPSVVDDYVLKMLIMARLPIVSIH